MKRSTGIPETHGALFEMGKAEEKREKWDRAGESREQAIELESEVAHVHFNPEGDAPCP